MTKGKCPAVLAMIGLATGLMTVPASAGPDESIQFRQLQMGTMGRSLRMMIYIAQGKLDQTEHFTALANQAAGATPLLGDAFQENTAGQGGVKTEAKDSIWENWEDFSGRLGKLDAGMQEVAELLNGGGSIKDAMPVLQEKVFSNCKGCHDEYRLEH